MQHPHHTPRPLPFKPLKPIFPFLFQSFYSNGPSLYYSTLFLPMSTTPSSLYATPPPPPPPLPQLPLSFPPPLTPPIAKNFLAEKLGLGYAIAIAFGFLVLLSAILLASYICCRSAAARRRRRFDSQSNLHDHNYNPSNPNETSIYLPRIIFVAEDENDEVSSSENVVVGLDQTVINSYPKFHFSKRSGNSICVGNDPVCAICLCDYKESEMLRLLPDCKHYFHVTCIDAWLKLNASCPVCRNSPLPTPLSTPLSEVVPLSQYSGGRRRS